MTKLIAAMIAASLVAGCATKPAPVEWCKVYDGEISDLRVPLRLSGCRSIKDGAIDQSHLRSFQSDVGVRSINVKVIK